MKFQKLFFKYSIILATYLFITRFIRPYGINLLYSFGYQPGMTAAEVNSLETTIATTTFIFNLLIALFILFDSKNKKPIDWIIFLSAVFDPSIGIVLFLLYNHYKYFKVTSPNKG